MITSIIKFSFAISAIAALVILGAKGAVVSAVLASALLICCYIDEKTNNKKDDKQ